MVSVHQRQHCRPIMPQSRDQINRCPSTSIKCDGLATLKEVLDCTQMLWKNRLVSCYLIMKEQSCIYIQIIYIKKISKIQVFEI